MLQIFKNMLKKICSKYHTYKIKRQCASYRLPLSVNGKSSVTPKTYLGENVNFNGMRISGCGKVVIGDNFHSGVECMMIAENHNYEGEAIPYDSTYKCGDINIEDNVWLGNRVIVLGGVTIGEGVIIQAGSVVVDNIPKYAIAGGHPAKVFSHRDKLHYAQLKKEGRFH